MTTLQILRTFGHVLWNAGFSDAAELEARTDRWARLMDTAKPDLIVFDHCADGASGRARARGARL